jgi:hydroxyacylglutathione hydrolase
VTEHGVRVSIDIALVAAAALCACDARPSPPRAPAPPRAEPATLRWTKLVLTSFQTNCYLLWDTGTKAALVIDPGDQPRRIHEAAATRGLAVTGIVETHGHDDHTAGSAELQELTGAPIYRDPLRVTRGGGLYVKALGPGEKLALGGFALEARHTPGHDPGSLSLLGPGLVFTGDLLFKGSVGRTDLEGGDESELLRSLHDVLADVPDETVVLPGHGEPTTMGEERRTNPFFAFARSHR